MKKQEMSDKEILISLILGEGRSQSIAAMHSMSVRLPVQIIMKVEELAERADVSRNKMFGHLLELALGEVEAEESFPIRKNIWDKYIANNETEMVNEFQGDEI